MNNRLWKKAPASLLALVAHLEARRQLTQGLSEVQQTTQSPWSCFPFPSCSCPSHVPHSFSVELQDPSSELGHTPPASRLKTLSCLQAMDNSPSTCSGPWKYDMSWSKQTRGVLSFTSTLGGFVLLSGDLFSILSVVPCSYLEIHSDGSSWAFSLFAGCHLAVLSFC